MWFVNPDYSSELRYRDALRRMTDVANNAIVRDRDRAVPAAADLVVAQYSQAVRMTAIGASCMFENEHSLG
jgi:hypothetical protein